MFSIDRILPLLKKYDVPGPRYTSYPTVPAWGELGATDYETSLKTIRTGEKLSLYFHLPFCESLCHFCGCTQVITKDHARSREYVNLLLKEIKRVASLIKAKEVNQVHFGGGTPNFLAPEELGALMEAIKGDFRIDSDAEIAIEMHPRTSTLAFCKKLKELGFNRISLGVQDLDPHVQKLINRHQTFEMTEKMVHDLRDLGFSSFNFDLVYGLPGQTSVGWGKTLAQVLSLRPERLAVYSYAHVPWIRPVQRTFEDSDLPRPEKKLEFFGDALKTFTSHGYCLIGMDHFALENDELARCASAGTLHRNFMGYSTRKDSHQIGFGMSAISFAGGNYFQNEKELKKYQARILEGALATFRGMILSEDDHVRRVLIMKIMCAGKIPGPDSAKLDSFIRDGLLVKKGSGYQATEEGSLFLRNIAMVFDKYLEGVKSKASTPVFSRTI
ncbi:MAG: oxygen-independent coproporphyrinogen III oxidase [Deltaproteobacteria bacterium]|nr:oxygen-independent coproporphyrinogen III oxidase [Deltaproteobacteria bacterium]